MNNAIEDCICEGEPPTDRPNVITFTDENLTKVVRSVRASLGWVIALLVVLLIFLVLTV